MIWIIGEYAERIDNADELLESFLEGFQDENSQVSQLLGCVIILAFFCVCVCVCVCMQGRESEGKIELCNALLN